MILNVFQIFSRFKQLWSFVCINYPAKEKFGFVGKDCYLEYPIFAQTPSSVFFHEHSKIRRGCTIINSPSEKIVIKKFTVISVNTTIVSQNHVSTVGIPQFLLGPSHINDKRADLIIEEDVWCGANVTLITGTRLGRGCIVAAGALVNKKVPPYAVVAGIPAKIIAVKFSKEQILQHEKVLYSEDERMSEAEIDELFKNYFEGKRVYGLTTDLRPYLEKFKEWQGDEQYLNYDSYSFYK